MTKPTAIFSAMAAKRVANHPFERVCAYKIRECRNNLTAECDAVSSVAAYQSARPKDRHAGMLRGCTPSDVATRLKAVPANIAEQLGYNLLPAVEALTIEGVPAAEIATFKARMIPSLHKLLAECDQVRAANKRGVAWEYAALEAGNSASQCLCEDALALAEAATEFCQTYNLYGGQP